jgi:N6-adenosine-specific RNA methylase IME4
MFLFDATFAGLTAHGYELIMADPPWDFGAWNELGLRKNPKKHYEVMGLDAIKALPVLDLAAPDCLLWLWATNPMLPQAIDTLRAWGFRFKTAGTWGKLTKTGKIAFGTGYVLRCASEPFLIGARGKPVTAKTVRTLIMGQLREHSRKPEEAYAAAEKLMPRARRLELFSRTDRPGWDHWGDQAGTWRTAA